MTNIPEELQERIAAYIDGELSPADAARLEVFLANTDPKLADEVIGMIADRHQVKLLARPAAPRELAAGIMEQLERTSLLHNVEQISVQQRRWWQSRSAMAAGLAVVLGGFSYFVYTSVISPSSADWRTRAAGGREAAAPVLADAAKGKAEDAAMMKGGAENLNEVPKAEGVGQIAAANGPVIPDVVASTPAAGPSKAGESADRIASGVAPPGVSVMNELNVTSAVRETQPAVIAEAVAAPETRQLASAGTAEQDVAIAPRAIAGARGGAGGAAGGGGGGGRGGRGGRGGGGAVGGFGGGATAIGGGFGGGGGGRGAALRSVAPAEESPAVQTVASTSDSTAKVLAAVTATADQPVLITFFAKDQQELTKLSEQLGTYDAANRKDVAGNVATKGNYFDINNNYRNNGQAGSNGVGNSSNGNFEQPQAGQGAAFNNGIANWGNSTQLYSQQNGLQQQRQNVPTSGPAGQAGAAPAVRLTLKREQLDELAGQYRVALIARGSDAYLFKTIGDHVPSTAEAAVRAQVYQGVGYTELQAQRVADMSKAAVVQPGVERQDAGAQARDAAGGAAAATLQQADVAPRANALAALPVLVDCIITVELAPAPAATAPVAK